MGCIGSKKSSTLSVNERIQLASSKRDEDSVGMKFKIILIGDNAVGKSSILYRFSDEVFDEGFSPSLNKLDFREKSVQVDGHDVVLSLWDTAGQERFRNITSSYFRGSHGVFIVFDVSNRSSFKNLSKWITEVNKYSSDHVVRILIGNKTDVNDREVSREEGEELAVNFDLKYFEVSAKSGDNIHEIFVEIASDIIEMAF
eukprot:TRINITY_DN576_c0_g1_i1.p1 TRINITY_DN576_c0_g1~~TRINITY_DN576_c0_g1_i1.p1  ORF type:complete len:200 (-),score=43.47 TRINITY_DN576_c0_g1_i1:116-715(-)